LLLAKAITADEHQTWKTYGRLPDHVDLDRPRAQAHVIAEQDRQMRNAQMLASLNISPMALQHLARR